MLFKNNKKPKSLFRFKLKTSNNSSEMDIFEKINKAKLKNIFKIKNLSVSFKNKEVLKNINMDIKSNCVTALIGPSGCGKSTFIKTLNRMNDFEENFKHSGNVFYEGIDIFRIKNTHMLRKEVGMVFQKPAPFLTSIYNNVSYGPKIHGIKDKKEIDKIVKKSLNMSGLWDEVKDRLHENAMSLSGGQQQRLCIARAIALKPDIILMDEPTSALDPLATEIIEDLILKLKEKFTIIIVTHSMKQAAKISDYTAFFKNGKLIEFGKTKQIFSTPSNKLTEKYITRR